MQAVGVEVVEECLAFGSLVGSLGGKQAVEHAHLGVDGVLCADPVQGSLHLAAVGGVATTGGRVVGAMDAGDVALGIFLHALGGDEIGIAQSHLAAQAQAEILLGSLLHKVLALDIELAAERNLTCAVGLVLGIVDGGEHFGLSFGIVVDDQFHRVQHCHAAGGHLVQMVAQAVLQAHIVDDVVALGHSDVLAEIADALGRVATAAETADGGHAGIVPAAHVVLLDQLQEFALAHHRVVDVEACKLVLVAGEDAQLLDKPVVERTVDVELKGADAVGDMLDRVALSVGVVVHGVDAPFVACAVVVGVQDAVHDGVAQLHVGVRHVYLGAQHLLAVGKLAVAHALKQIEVLLDAAVAPGAVLAGLGDGAAAEADLLLRLVVDVGQSLLDEDHGPLVELLEIVAGVVHSGPFKAQPADILLDGVHILGVLLHGVRVVETEIGLSAIFLGEAEVKADRLGVADVQIAVGFWREARQNGFVGALVEALFDDFFQKIKRQVFFHLYKILII